MGHLRVDKGIENFAAMRETVHEHSYWTPRMARFGLIYGVLVPLGIYWVCGRFDNYYDARGKTRGMSRYKFPRLVYQKEIEAEEAAKGKQ
ncbi:hypothetical protein DSO57_1021545 [Entomophthora muscae]|uniref:Uncharacterized protein n=1 Tax=Entomophthora muscae TaxID=34485 RepID=A0ACC2SG90_9FUNG|nr:hypothetical protein DSO57_1021545 [Entomophthora muscae]